jgi:hypothetical protein
MFCLLAAPSRHSCKLLAGATLTSSTRRCLNLNNDTRAMNIIMVWCVDVVARNQRRDQLPCSTNLQEVLGLYAMMCANKYRPLLLLPCPLELERTIPGFTFTLTLLYSTTLVRILSADSGLVIGVVPTCLSSSEFEF